MKKRDWFLGFEPGTLRVDFNDRLSILLLVLIYKKN